MYHCQKQHRGDILSDNKYLIVDSSVLPDVFLKVVKAKELLAKNIAKNSSNACEMVELSRSTFYRYKDCVDVFDNAKFKTVTLYLSLDDKPGVLAAVLDVLRNAGANVLTINQNIPINGVAPVCISLRDNNMQSDILNALDSLRAINGVIEVKLARF